LILIVLLAALNGAWLSDAGAAVTCNNGTLPLGGGYQDLEVTEPCVVAGTTGTDTALYQYENINIYVKDPTAGAVVRAYGPTDARAAPTQ
jgi:hypothetical protein